MKLAVFDCDGTLIDGQASICHAMERAFAGEGLAPPPRNLIRRAVGLSLPQALAKLMPDATRLLLADLTEGYKHAFRASRESGDLSQAMFEGMADLLRRLHGDGWLLGVATGMSQRGLTHCLASHGIADLFVTLQTADHHPSKPHPAMLKAALAEAGAVPDEAVMIGDTAYDMAMAATAGVRAIGVDWGYHDVHELQAAGAEWVATSPQQLGEYLLT